MALTFTKDAASITFTGRALPVHDPKRVNVVVDYSEGRQLYAYDKGVTEQLFNLDITLEEEAAFTAFDNWFENIACGPKNTFTFTDEAAAAHTVRLMNTENPLREVSVGRYSGTIVLREEL